MRGRFACASELPGKVLCCWRFRIALFGVNSHLATVRLLELRKPVLTPPQSRYLAGMPLLLGSWYGLIGTVIFAMGISARAVQEERKLQRELPGYAD